MNQSNPDPRPSPQSQKANDDALDPPALLARLDAQLDDEGLRDLCLQLGVDYDNLGGRGKKDKARELISLLKRTGRLAELTALRPSLRPGVPYVPDDLRPYLRVVARHNQALPLAPLDPKGRDSATITLEQIFIHLETNVTTLKTHSLPDGNNRHLSSNSALAHIHDQRRVILLGDPGSGKSTILRYLAYCLAGAALHPDGQWLEQLSWPARMIESAAADPKRAWAEVERARRRDDDAVQEVQGQWSLGVYAPVLVELRNFAQTEFDPDSPLALWRYVAAEARRRGLADALPGLEALAKRGRVLLLLDGVDEVPPGQRPAIWRAIRALEEGPLVNARWAATCRVLSFAPGEAPDVSPCTLSPLGESQIDQFIAAWYGVLGQLGELREEQVEEMTGTLQEAVRRPRLRPLGENPMLLTIMALVQTYYGTLPEERAKLYQACVETLLLRWQRHKETGAAGELPDVLTQLGTTKENLERLLWQIAWQAHRRAADRKEAADIGEGELMQLAKSHLGSYAAAERFVTYTERRAHLLVGKGGRERRVFTFPHRTFQEYLAACFIASQRDYSRGAPLLAARGETWREVLALATGALVFNQNNREKALDAIDRVLPRRVPGDEGGWYRVWLAAEMLLVVGQEAAARDAVGRDLLPRLRRLLARLVSGGRLTPPQRAEAGEALAALGDDRPGVRACDEMGFCLVPAGPFWMENPEEEGHGVWIEALHKPYWLAQYPVTVAQFRQFVDASGFAPSRGERSLQGPDNWPVAYVNWYDALAFCRWLEARWREKGWLPDGYRVTLPNEMEWEKAARGGKRLPERPEIATPHQLRGATAAALAADTGRENPQPKRPYPWGKAPPEEENEAGETLYRANDKSAGVGGRCAVGGFPAGRSPAGCLDMSGGVWEWTRSLHGKPFPPQLTPEFETADSSNRSNIVLRGGAYHNDQPRCSARFGNYPHYIFGDSGGVRLVVSPFLASGR
jgi:formylglycine-generating enzyme required for sulfatase activity/energy-coupling factor transporter ATP-binding protein EcfA2